MIEFCETQKYTTKRVYILVEELNKVEMLLKDVLQYYHYFIRPDFKQKPDVELATETFPKEDCVSITISSKNIGSSTSKT